MKRKRWLFAVLMSALTVASMVPMSPARAAPFEAATECTDAAPGLTVCIQLQASATRVTNDLCGGLPDPGEFCYRMRESGNAFATSGLSGGASVIGHYNRECSWSVVGSVLRLKPWEAYCVVEPKDAYHFDRPHADCFALQGRAWVVLLGGTVMTSPVAGVSPDCI